MVESVSADIGWDCNLTIAEQYDIKTFGYYPTDSNTLYI